MAAHTVPDGAEANTTPTQATETSPVSDRNATEDQHNEAMSSQSSSHSIDAEKEREPEVAAVTEEPGKDGGPLARKPSMEGRSKGKIAIIMFALCMAVFLAALDVTIVTTALPTIAEDFHSSSGYTWVGSAFLLANSASVPSWGKISDIFGRKPMLLFANIIFMVGSLVAALSNSIGMLIAARAVQGIGGGGLIILVNIVIGDIFPLRIRGAFYGIIGGVWALASSIGPIIGGLFTQDVTWRWCFYVNLPLDGAAFLILLLFLDVKTPRTPLIEGLKAIDWIGSLLVVGGTLMFLFGLQFGGVSHPWSSAIVVCLLVFGVVTLGLFLYWEYRFAKYPIMPMALFSKVTNCATLGVVFFHGYVFIAVTYYLPLYFQAIRGATPILSGVYLLPTAIAISISSIVTGIFTGKLGQFLPPIYFGMSMMTLGLGLFIDFDAHSSWAKLIIFQIITSLGIGPIFQAPLIALHAHIEPRDIGTGTATLGFIRQLATSTSVVIGQVVYQNQFDKKSSAITKLLGPRLAHQFSGGAIGAETHLIDALPPHARSIIRKYFADSLQPMWIMYTAFAAAGFVCSLFIMRKKLSREHQETKTGLEAERENAKLRRAERDAKRDHKRQSRSRNGHVTSPSPPVSPSPASTGLVKSDDPEKSRDLEAATA